MDGNGNICKQPMIPMINGSSMDQSGPRIWINFQSVYPVRFSLTRLGLFRCITRLMKVHFDTIWNVPENRSSVNNSRNYRFLLWITTYQLQNPEMDMIRLWKFGFLWIFWSKICSHRPVQIENSQNILAVLPPGVPVILLMVQKSGVANHLRLVVPPMIKTVF